MLFILLVLLPRLTGLYAIVIGLHATLVKFFATGVQVTEMLLRKGIPFIDQFSFQSYLITMQVEYCQTKWWTNLLYVNNLHWVDEEGIGCIGQGW